MRTVTQQQAQSLERARREILQSGDWLLADELSVLASQRDQASESNPYSWLRDDKIFAISYDGKDYFPRYALDVGRGYQPVPSLLDVIRILKVMKNGWEMAFWFASPNSHLADQRPQDVMCNHIKDVVDAAQQEVASISHG
ncbi:hypothetical protein [Pseudomonas guariconensis]|uniref:hypothetical protein n=1 Tax=Pseudomonas guariconensis TaxID=1288410 RepID=UPI003464F7DD